MKLKHISFIVIKWLLLFNLLVLLVGVFQFYSYFRLNYKGTSVEFLMGRSITLLFINLLLIVLIFLINKKVYIVLFLIITISGVWFWIYREMMKNLGEYALSIDMKILFEFILFLTYSIMAPGLILLLIAYIKKLTPRIHGNILQRYHIHENVLGLSLFIIGVCSLLFRGNLITYDIFWNEFKIALAIINIITFVFLFFGIFFLSRDFHDTLRLKFIEKLPHNEVKNGAKTEKDALIFGRITKQDLHFFKTPMFPLYPMGMVLTSFSFLMVIYGSDFLPYELFFIPYNTIVLLGYIVCCIAAAMIGFDWFRLFEIFYPQLYSKIHQVLRELKKERRKKKKS